MPEDSQRRGENDRGQRSFLLGARAAEKESKALPCLSWGETLLVLAGVWISLGGGASPGGAGRGPSEGIRG